MNERYKGGRYEKPVINEAKLDISSAYPKEDGQWIWTKTDWVKAGMYIAALVVLACIGLCGCDTNDAGLPCTSDITADAGPDVRPPKHPEVLRQDAATLPPRWQSGWVPEQCEAEVKARDGLLYACPPQWSCWDRTRCWCMAGPTCEAKARKQQHARDCICTGMPGDWIEP